MSNEPKATHVAVHALQYRDEKGVTREIAPKTEFAPATMVKELGPVADLERKGAIRKLKPVKVVETEDEKSSGETKPKA